MNAITPGTIIPFPVQRTAPDVPRGGEENAATHPSSLTHPPSSHIIPFPCIKPDPRQPDTCTERAGTGAKLAFHTQSGAACHIAIGYIGRRHTPDFYHTFQDHAHLRAFLEHWLEQK